LNTIAGETELSSGILCNAAIRWVWSFSPSTIISRSSGSNFSPATSSASAIVDAVISRASSAATFAQRIPGRSVLPSPTLVKYAMNSRRS
jgi:hypothetical protein